MFVDWDSNPRIGIDLGRHPGWVMGAYPRRQCVALYAQDCKFEDEKEVLCSKCLENSENTSDPHEVNIYSTFILVRMYLTDLTDGLFD